MPRSHSSSRGLPTPWQIAVVLTASAYAFLLPLDWVLDLNGAPVATLRWLALLVFVADVFVSWTGPDSGGVGAGGPRGTGRTRYLRSILTFDVLATAPFYALTGSVGLGLFGLLKLVKVGALLAMWRRRSVRFDTWVLLGFGVYWLVLAGHWISCGWLALEGMPSGSSAASAYVRGVYWTVTTVTSVGYGDITPATDAQRIYAIVTMLVGLSFFGYVVGVFARILGRVDPGTERFRLGVERLSHATATGRLPGDLRQRVWDYHWYVWQNKVAYDEELFLSDLPPSLRAEVSYHLKKELLHRVTLFHETGEDFLEDIAQYLRPEVHTPGDLICEVGDRGEQMWFIARGAAEVLDQSGRLIGHLGEGDFFGEIALFSDGVRTATVRTIAYTHVYVLDRRAMRHLARRHPEVHAQIEARAMERQRRDRAPGGAAEDREMPPTTEP